MIYVTRYLLGFINLLIIGPYENFLNLISKRGLTMWNIKKTKQGLILSIPRSQLSLASQAATKSAVKLEIASQKGVPFLWQYYKKKIGVLAGIVIFFLVLHIMSLYVWVVRIEGNSTIPSENLTTIVSELGLRPGTLKKSIAVPYIEHNTILQQPEISWMSVNLQGSIASVCVKEKDTPPEIIPEKEVCNIKAKCDGQIIMIQVFKGEAEVKNGDAVSKGELLVSGTYDDDTEEVRMQHAQAKVIANTKHEFNYDIEMFQQVPHYTGKHLTRKKISLFGLDIPLTPVSPPSNAETYDCISKDKKIEIFGVLLPISIHTDIWNQQELSTEKISKYDALNMMNNQIKEFEKTELKDTNIIFADRNDNFTDERLHTCIVYKCQEDIAIQESSP